MTNQKRLTFTGNNGKSYEVSPLMRANRVFVNGRKVISFANFEVAKSYAIGHANGIKVTLDHE